MAWKIGTVISAVACIGATVYTSAAAAQVTPAAPFEPVPMVAPDTRPAWFDDDSSWAGEGVFCALKRVVSLRFNDSTPPAQRQAAVDSAHGRVIGGWRFVPNEEGLYAVKIDTGATTRAERDKLLDKLRTLPQVRSAMPVRAIPSPARKARGACQ